MPRGVRYLPRKVDPDLREMRAGMPGSVIE
jgi:hypothetical protein